MEAKQWTADEGRQAPEEWRASGLSRNACSRKTGVFPQRLRWWRNRLSEWAETQSRRLKFGEYLLNHRVVLTRFLDNNGVIPIDNGVVERLHVPTAMTRNFLFAGSDAGAERAAIVYTVLGCCALADVNPSSTSPTPCRSSRGAAVSRTSRDDARRVEAFARRALNSAVITPGRPR
jgi:hypothetical protein